MPTSKSSTLRLIAGTSASTRLSSCFNSSPIFSRESAFIRPASGPFSSLIIGAIELLASVADLSKLSRSFAIRSSANLFRATRSSEVFFRENSPAISRSSSRFEVLSDSCSLSLWDTVNVASDIQAVLTDSAHSATTDLSWPRSPIRDSIRAARNNLLAGYAESRNALICGMILAICTMPPM